MDDIVCAEVATTFLLLINKWNFPDAVYSICYLKYIHALPTLSFFTGENKITPGVRYYPTTLPTIHCITPWFAVRIIILFTISWSNKELTLYFATLFFRNISFMCYFYASHSKEGQLYFRPLQATAFSFGQCVTEIAQPFCNQQWGRICAIPLYKWDINLHKVDIQLDGHTYGHDPGLHWT